MSKKRRRGRPAPRSRAPSDLPDSAFVPISLEIDAWLKYYNDKWPHGVSPNKSASPVAREIGPAARAYKAGVRAASLHEKMVEILAWLKGIGGELPAPGEESPNE